MYVNVFEDEKLQKVYKTKDREIFRYVLEILWSTYEIYKLDLMEDLKKYNYSPQQRNVSRNEWRLKLSFYTKQN